MYADNIIVLTTWVGVTLRVSRRLRPRRFVTDFIAILINIYDSILCRARETHMARADCDVINRFRQTLYVLAIRDASLKLI